MQTDKMTMGLATTHRQQSPWLRPSAMAVGSRLNHLTQKFTFTSTLFPWVSDAQRYRECHQEPRKTERWVDRVSLTYVSFCCFTKTRFSFHTKAVPEAVLEPHEAFSHPQLAWMTLKRQSTVAAKGWGSFTELWARSQRCDQAISREPIVNQIHNFSFNSSEWKLGVKDSTKAKTELASSHMRQHMSLSTCIVKQIPNGKQMIFNFLFCLLVKKTFLKTCISSCKLLCCKDKCQLCEMLGK